jgi:hypothetical protein
MGKQQRSRTARTTPNHKIVFRFLCGVCNSGNGSKVLIVCEVPFSDPLGKTSSSFWMFLSLSLDIVVHDVCKAISTLAGCCGKAIIQNSKNTTSCALMIKEIEFGSIVS